MSKKTDNIRTIISKLSQLQLQLSDYNKEAQIRELDNIQFEMQQNLKELNFWIDSLYSYNGKSTSNAKKAASRENGKKGGRPPKEVTEARRRINQLENELIPQIEHKLKMTDDVEEETELSGQKVQFQLELGLLNEKIVLWDEKKK